jgi:ABC-type transporter Mla subunit MlaD
MNSAVAVFLLALVAPGCQGSLTFDVGAAKSRPVTKVITLLKDMLKQLEKEADEDEEIYDKIACWCETNDKEKTKAIKDAESRIKGLSTTIEELSAMSAKYATQIKNAKAEVAEDQESLAQATELRRKQLAEFNAEEKDMLESIEALKAAITVLGTHSAAFLQVPHSHKLGVAATVQHEMQKHASILKGVMTPSMRRTVASFLQAPEDYFDSEPTFKQSYAPQSGQIFGILRQMKETFEANLSQAQKDEMANAKAYEEVKAAKEAEIKAGLEFIDQKTADLATAREKLEMAKQDIVDTKASLNADEQFLLELKDKCQMTDKEWEERQKTRQLEMEAVSKALAILSGDDAHDVFTRTFTPALVQTESTLKSTRRAEASKLLSAVAHKLNKPKLAALAVQIRLDAFTKVKKAIDDLVAALLKEKEEEIKVRDFCTAEFNENQLQTEKKEDEKKDLIAKIEDLEMLIKELADAIATLESEIEEMQVQLKRAGEDREKQNAEFQATVADQRETQKLLKAALKVLEGFYGKSAEPEVALAQKQPAGPPPPPGFEEYKNSGANGDVMAMIMQIITDAKAMEAEAIRAEADAQQAYEDFVKETNLSIEAKQRDIVSKSEDKAKAETDLVETKEDKEGVMLELEDLSNYNAELHAKCDFTLKNFEIRQTARDEEVEALRQAKSILSGAGMQADLGQGYDGAYKF